MNNLPRKIYTKIATDLKKKMVFVVGPRQVGKTWLAKEIMKEYKNPLYLNYDNQDHVQILKKQAWLAEHDLVIFDEIHKMPKWKNYIKGIYDTKPNTMHMLITGSASMDTFRKAGDSLAGRFFIYHLMPFSLSELKNTYLENNLSILFKKSGFPEPLFSQNDEDANRWRKLYADTLLRQDVLEFQDIEKVGAIRQVYNILKNKVGSTISYSNIAGDVGISPITVKKYIQILESLYILFIIKPYTHKMARSILKEPKVYFFDYGVIEDEGARFENFVALSLYKNIVTKNDITGSNMGLNFLKTKDQKEVDFAISDNNELKEIIEVKVSDNKLSQALKYFSEKYNIKGVQLVRYADLEIMLNNNIQLRSANKYLSDLDW